MVGVEIACGVFVNKNQSFFFPAYLEFESTTTWQHQNFSLSLAQFSLKQQLGPTRHNGQNDWEPHLVSIKNCMSSYHKESTGHACPNNLSRRIQSKIVTVCLILQSDKDILQIFVWYFRFCTVWGFKRIKSNICGTASTSTILSHYFLRSYKF